jgi:NHL repeat
VLASLSSTTHTPGTLLECFRGDPAQPLMQPTNVAIDPYGNILVADTNNNRVVILAGITSTSPSPGSLLYAFSDNTQSILAPIGVAFDTAGHIYVVDDDNNRVVILQGITPAGTALGDPQFQGFLGQSYQVHGIDGAVYSIISSASLQLNARFAFLAQGRCPVYTRTRPAINCWSHPGSYFGALAMRTQAGSRLLIEAGDAATGFQSIILDGINLTTSAVTADIRGEAVEVRGCGLTVRLLDRHHLTVVHGVFGVSIDSSDRFLNLAEVAISSWSELVRNVKPHGLLGQSWRRLEGADRGVDVPQVAGAVDDYADGDNDIFGVNNIHSRFDLEKSSDCKAAAL